VGAVECATARCVDGRCLFEPADAECGTDERCDREMGCVPAATCEPSLCYTGPDGTGDVGVCRPGVRRCEAPDVCDGEVTPTPEVCQGGEDEDCDGRTDCADEDCLEDPACVVPPSTEPRCLTPADPEWLESGDDYCVRFGLRCTGVDYFGSSEDCSGDAYVECWGASVADCCRWALRDHAGTSPASARWRCEP
jgi:hypothetical protein